MTEAGEERLSVVINAIAFEMLRHDGRPVTVNPDGAEEIDATGEEIARCRAAAQRVLDHLAEYDEAVWQRSLAATQEPCEVCDGKGYILSNGMIAKRYPCPACHELYDDNARQAVAETTPEVGGDPFR